MSKVNSADTEKQTDAAQTPPANTAEDESLKFDNGDKNEGKDNDKKENVNPDRKLGLTSFIQLSKPNKYVEAILRNRRSMEVHTLAEWQQIVKDLLKTKVS